MASSSILTQPPVTNDFFSTGDKRPGRMTLESWLNETMKIQMTDGRIVIGTFLCTDKDKNIVLGSACEYVTSTCKPNDNTQPTSQDERDQRVSKPLDAGRGPRNLGLAMVPGNHIVSIHLDQSGLKLRESTHVNNNRSQ